MGFQVTKQRNMQERRIFENEEAKIRIAIKKADDFTKKNFKIRSPYREIAESIFG